MKRPRHDRFWTLCCLLLLNACAQAAPTVVEGFPASTLEIRTGGGRHWFSIAIADTPQRQQRGLMFVPELPADQGMLFPQSPPRVMTMWMKNTLIPLDMLFIDARGRIVCLRERTTPHSEDIITCEQPVAAVLELRGGEAARRGIKVGDSVVHGTFAAPKIP